MHMMVSSGRTLATGASSCRDHSGSCRLLLQALPLSIQLLLQLLELTTSRICRASRPAHSGQLRQQFRNRVHLTRERRAETVQAGAGVTVTAHERGERVGAWVSAIAAELEGVSVDRAGSGSVRGVAYCDTGLGGERGARCVLWVVQAPGEAQRCRRCCHCVCAWWTDYSAASVEGVDAFLIVNDQIKLVIRKRRRGGIFVDLRQMKLLNRYYLRQ